MQYHYTYSITYTDVPNIYYGVRTSKCLPEEDTKYWGSPKRFKTFMDAHKSTRIKTILSTYPTREEAELAEDNLILEQWAQNKPLSLNAGIKGEKFNTLGGSHTQKQRDALIKLQEDNIKPYYLVSPDGKVFEGSNLTQFCNEEKLHRSGFSRVVLGKCFHCLGWTASLEAHHLYKEIFANRGVNWNEKSKLWCVLWCEQGKVKSKYFRLKDDAISYRNSLEDAGYEFGIKAKNWKKRLAS